MSDPTPQNLGNHIRLDKPYFFVVAPLLLLGVISAIIGLFKEPFSNIAVLLISLGSIGLFVRARSYAATVQDRVIRTEMRVRLARLLGPENHGRIDALTRQQMVGLRFASDAELPGLVEKVEKENIGSTGAIKKLVTDWQGDHFRV